MVSKDVISLLKLAHGGSNLVIFIGFLYQAILGLRVRSARRRGNPNATVIRHHRKFGPMLAMLGILGALSGPILTDVDKGRIIEYPLHLIGGMIVIVLISLVFTVSRAIKGGDSSPRTIHLIMGILLLAAYTTQAVIGLGILL